jgi:hypothetical protein
MSVLVDNDEVPEVAKAAEDPDTAMTSFSIDASFLETSAADPEPAAPTKRGRGRQPKAKPIQNPASAESESAVKATSDQQLERSLLPEPTKNEDLANHASSSKPPLTTSKARATRSKAKAVVEDILPPTETSAESSMQDVIEINPGGRVPSDIQENLDGPVKPSKRGNQKQTVELKEDKKRDPKKKPTRTKTIVRFAAVSTHDEKDDNNSDQDDDENENDIGDASMMDSTGDVTMTEINSKDVQDASNTFMTEIEATPKKPAPLNQAIATSAPTDIDAMLEMMLSGPGSAKHVQSKNVTYESLTVDERQLTVEEYLRREMNLQIARVRREAAKALETLQLESSRVRKRIEGLSNVI